MDKKALEDKELEIKVIIDSDTPDVDKALELIGEMPLVKAAELLAELAEKLSDKADFAGTFKIVKTCTAQISSRMQPTQVRDLLRKATKDRLVASFIDSCDFSERSIEDSVERLNRLLAFKPGMLVLSPAWGLGEVKRLDYFYRKITVDFKSRKALQMTFQTACETLTAAPDDHVLVIAKIDPPRIQNMLKDAPAELVKLMLKSYGDLTLVRLEELLVSGGFIKAGTFKAFWDKARAGLKSDKLVDIPVRRADSIHLKAEAESYGDAWFAAFGAMTDPKEILAAVRTLVSVKKVPLEGDPNREKIEDRLAFAVKGVRYVDDALYAQLACTTTENGFSKPSAETMRTYLWDHDRYLDAARTMPAREVRSLIYFLTNKGTDAEGRDRLLKAIPVMCFQLLSELLEAYRSDAACEAEVARLLKEPKAPATLVTYIVARRDIFADWKQLPSQVTVLAHAIALGEGRQNGETLRMQNIVRRLFADQKWLKETIESLSDADRKLFFERFQASIAWDPSMHHTITIRMTNIDPNLKALLSKPAKKVEDIVRITSLRSYAERKAAYKKLVNEDIPANIRDIEEARSKGDLRENSEYQYAKDKERELQKKQQDMSEELEAVKATDFAEVATDKVNAGTTVTLKLADGAEKVYVILGEWDNDLSQNIIANRTPLAMNMIGKTIGDSVELRDAEGGVSVATISKIDGLSEAIKEWIKVPAGLSI